MMPSVIMIKNINHESDIDFPSGEEDTLKRNPVNLPIARECQGCVGVE